MANFLIQPKTLRPDFRLVILFLWGDLANADTDGNADNPASRDWTELYGANRQRAQEVFDVVPVTDEPLTLCVSSQLSELAARAAYFLAIETKSRVATNATGPWHDPSWLADKVGAFDLTEAIERTVRSLLRQATRDNPYPTAPRR